MADDHGHGHGHHGHGHHDHSADNQRRVGWAFVLTATFLVAEVIGGILSGSLALLADAGHMLADAFALGLSFVAFHAARRPASGRHSYGWMRAQVLAAFVNGAALVGISAWIAIEAVQRLFAPVPVLAGPMLAVAVAGLAVNAVCFAILHGGDRANINIRGAALHVLGDLLGSVAAIAAAAGILWTGWMPLDPLLSLLVTMLILRSAWALVARSTHILMEGAPEDMDVAELRRDLCAAVPGVIDIHHVHLWMLTPEHPLITLHAQVDGTRDDQAVLRDLHAALARLFDLPHATIQIERGACCGPRDCR